MRDYGVMDERTAKDYLDQYVAQLPELRLRLARRLEVSQGPGTDDSLEALRALDDWYLREIQHPTPDGLAGTPLWWDPATEGPTPTDVQLRLVDEVGAHVASVLQRAVPSAHWLVRKQPGGARTHGHHTTVLQVGPAQLQPWNLAYGHIPALLTDRPLRPGLLRDKVTKAVATAGGVINH